MSNSAVSKHPVLLSNTDTSCESCANFSIFRKAQTLPHRLPLSVSLSSSHDKFHVKSRWLPEFSRHVRTLSHINTRRQSSSNLISGCGESLFEDKGFPPPTHPPRLRRAAGGDETRRRLAAEWEERARGGGGGMCWGEGAHKDGG